MSEYSNLSKEELLDVIERLQKDKDCIVSEVSRLTSVHDRLHELTPHDCETCQFGPVCVDVPGSTYCTSRHTARIPTRVSRTIIQYKCSNCHCDLGFIPGDYIECPNCLQPVDWKLPEQVEPAR